MLINLSFLILHDITKIKWFHRKAIERILRKTHNSYIKK